MRILIVGYKKDFTAEYFYSKALSKLGHEVSLIDEYEGIKRPLFARVMFTRTRMLRFFLNRMEVNNNIVEKARKADADVILIFKGEFLSDSSLADLSENFRTYLFYPDTYKYKPILKNRLHYFNAVFTAANSTDFYYNLGAKKVVTVPWACDPDFHRKMNIEKKYDISFIGTAYRERRKIIRKCDNIHVFGVLWYGFGGFSHRPVYGNDFVRTINETKINLNLQAQVSIMADAPTARTFEVSGSGGFQISDSMSSIGRYFPRIPTFGSTDELKELIDYFLDNETEREERALDCYYRCRKYFKFTDAAKLITSYM